jgi:excisionase family DNA binding protein
MDRGDGQTTDASVDRLTMAEAAKRLGVTKDAIRKRVQRGNLPYEKDSDGVIHVYLDAGDSHPGTWGQTSTGADPRTRGRTSTDIEMVPKATVDVLQDQVQFLRAELERKDTIIMSLTQRIPELEPASELRGSHETATENSGKGDDVPPEQEQRSWWRRMFGG